MNYIKAKSWNGKDLKGEWDVEFKIDGVRVLWDEERQKPVSRDNKVFEGLDISFTPSAIEKLKEYKDCEFFVQDWNTSVSYARNVKDAMPDSLINTTLYPLNDTDYRLVFALLEDPTAEEINILLDDALSLGYEGLVLKQGSTWLRVKPKITADVRVLAIIEGTGKHKGRMGALVTTLGKVGTGFKDADREWWWYQAPNVIGSLIEIEYTELTKNAKPRFPRFKRVRTDKNTESRDDV